MDFEVFFEQTRNRFRSIRRLIFLLNNGTTAEEVHNSALSPIEELAVFLNEYNNHSKFNPDLSGYVSVHRDKSQLVRSNDCDWTQSSFHELADEAYGIVFEILDACVREQVNKKGNRFTEDEQENWSVAICDREGEGSLPGDFFDAIANEFTNALKQRYPWVTSGSWQIHVDKGLESEEKTARAAWMPHKQMLAQTNRSKDTNTGESQETAEKTKTSITKTPTSKTLPHSKWTDKENLIIAELIRHHQYGEGSCKNYDAITQNQTAKALGVSSATISTFWAKAFSGKEKKGRFTTYKQFCQDSVLLNKTLEILSGDLTPGILRNSYHG